MTDPKLFVHGVPDTSAIWTPLITALGRLGDDVVAPTLPGFGAPPPPGFKATKDNYTNWMIGEMETLHAEKGPIDLVGHDWGALFVLRAACLRPDLVRSWTISNAVIDESYPGHRIARLWNIPLLGELMMAVSPATQIEKGFVDAGVPADIARIEAEAWRSKHTRSAILALYRSANGLRFSGPWVDDLKKLPPNGLMVWGDADPYMPFEHGERFAKRWNLKLSRQEGAQHWAIAERPDDVAGALQEFWASV